MAVILIFPSPSVAKVNDVAPTVNGWATVSNERTRLFTLSVYPELVVNACIHTSYSDDALNPVIGYDVEVVVCSVALFSAFGDFL